MIPKVYSPSFDIINKHCTERINLLAYELCCFYMNCEIFYFPKIANTKFNAQKPPQKQFLFKNMIKMINDLKQCYSAAEFIGYIKAQFEIMKLNSKYDPLITPNMLHGKKAEYRYAYWLQLVADKKIMENGRESKLPIKYLDHLMKISKNNIEKWFGSDIKLEDFIKHEKRLIIMAKAKQISHVYCFSSNWIKKLSEEAISDIYKFSECSVLEQCNVDEIKDIYLKYFDYET